MKKEKGKRVISAAVVLASASSSKKKDAGGGAGQPQSKKAEAKSKKTGTKPLAVVATAGAISKRQCSAMDFPDENLSTFVIDRSVRKVSSISMQPTFQEPNCIVGLETANAEIKPSTDQGCGPSLGQDCGPIPDRDLGPRLWAKPWAQILGQGRP